MINAGKEKK